MGRADIGRKRRKIVSTGDLGRIKGKSSSREREGVALIDRPRLVIISRLVHCRFFGTAHAHYCFPNSDPVADHVHFPIPQVLPPPAPFIYCLPLLEVLGNL